MASVSASLSFLFASLPRYFEIPRSAIVSMVQDGDPKTGPVKLYVRGSATVVSAGRLPAATAASVSQRAETLPGATARGLLQCQIWAAQCTGLAQGIACILAAGCLAGLEQ
jgi:hypothetical protein